METKLVFLWAATEKKETIILTIIITIISIVWGSRTNNDVKWLLLTTQKYISLRQFFILWLHKVRNFEQTRNGYINAKSHLRSRFLGMSRNTPPLRDILWNGWEGEHIFGCRTLCGNAAPSLLWCYIQTGIFSRWFHKQCTNHNKVNYRTCLATFNYS